MAAPWAPGPPGTAPPRELALLRQATACYLAVVRDCAGRVAESGPAGDLVAALEDGRGTPASIARGVAVLLGLATTPALETQPAALEAVRGPVRG